MERHKAMQNEAKFGGEINVQKIIYNEEEEHTLNQTDIMN